MSTATGTGPTPDDLRHQPVLQAELRALLTNPGPAHLLISGPAACGQGLAARAIAHAMADGDTPVIVKVLPVELSTQFPSDAIDRLQEAHRAATGGVLYLPELESLLPDQNAVPLLAALRELIRSDVPVTVVLTGDKEAVDRLHALSPDLFLHFRHASVTALSLSQVVDLLVLSLRSSGIAVEPTFAQQALPLMRRLRVVGNLRNARLVSALTRHIVAYAALAGTTTIGAADLQLAAPEMFVTSRSQSGFQDLDELIGLSDVKNTVRLWMANSDLMIRREQLGLQTAGMGQHMVFKGPAGTAKTTVARVVGAILAETGVLASGHVIEVQRGDIIGDQPEQVARRMIELVKRAIGGVLFIDEAYTLSPQKGERDVGREAIDTLLKMMEDYREEFVVIVAGYPVEMEQFLNANPGLRSRFSRTLEFPAYSADELLQILDFQAAKRGFVVAREVHVALHQRLSLASHYPGFGNGRHMRNLLEAAIVRQGTRLGEEATDDDLRILLLADFEDPAAAPAERTTVL